MFGSLYFRYDSHKADTGVLSERLVANEVELLLVQLILLPGVAGAVEMNCRC